MSSIFSKIIKGEIPCYKIAEDDRFFAFLDINPLNEGHTLVVPKVEIDYLFDIDDDLYKDLMLFAKNVSIAIKKTIPCLRVGVAVVGLEVPHAHIHLIPLQKASDIDFSRPKIKYTKDEFLEIANRIKQNL